MYSNHKSFFVNLFSSIFVLSGYYYLVKYCDSFNNGDPVGLFTNTYYIRGLTDMLCGGMLYRIILELKKHNFTSLSYALFRIIEVLSFIMLFYAVGRYGNCNNDIYFVLLICVIVIISFMYPDDKGDVFKKFKGVNDLMYPVYLNHIFVLHIVCSIPQFSIMVNWNKKIAIIVLFIAICIYSFFTMKLLKIIQFIIHKARGLFIEEGKTIL